VGELFGFAADKISRFDIKLVVRPYGHVRRQTISCRSRSTSLMKKPGADLSQGVWLSVPKHDEVLRVEGDHKISIVALKCHQPSRMHHARGQRTLLRNANRDIQKK
jgi:hypothetical protein